MIDTNSDFHVENEFIATTDYSAVWKLRTTLTQGNEVLTMEKECRNYLHALNSSWRGEMGFNFANWDNRFRALNEAFELDYAQS